MTPPDSPRSPDDPFVVDPVTGAVTGCGLLARHLLISPVRHRPWCRPAGLADCFLALASALVSDRDITLVDPDFSPRELEALGVRAASLEGVEEVPAVHRGPDLAAVLESVLQGCRSRITLFTSGSTGLPKAVRHGLPGLTRTLRVGPGHARDVWGFAYNPTHIAGVQVFLQALFNRNPLVNLFRLPREAALEAVAAHGITHISATPTFYRLLLPADRPLPGVRSVTLGGERADASLLDRLRALFPGARFHNLYASTEAGTLLSAEGELFGIPETLRDRVVIRDGRLHVHRSLMGDFVDAAPADAWYDTGDVVEVVGDDPLRFRIVSRARDWVNVGGNKVNPAEVEAALTEHPGVRQARVFGRSSPVTGAVLCAEVVPGDPPPTEPELRQYLAGRLQPFKVPRVFRLVNAIDQTRTGKVRRDE